MANVPFYVNGVFIFTTLATVIFFFFATRQHKILLGIVSLLLVGQASLAYAGFFHDSKTFPPRVAVLLLPSTLLMLYAFFSRVGKAFIRNLDIRLYSYLHIIRIPVEFTILWLFMHQYMPQSMTFEGRNFDILSGITAPFVAYFGWQKGVPNRTLLLIWNIVCLGLVLQVVGTGILSAPTPFQQLSFDQPNTGILYFPFVWLPAVVVPIVIFGHLATINRIWHKTL
jgi:hypothetical protein